METPASHSYVGDGSTRIFPVSSDIQGNDFIRIEIDEELITDRSTYDIINNSIVFLEAPANASVVTIKVAQSQEAVANLGIATNIDIVATDIDNINSVGNAISEVLSLESIKDEVLSLESIKAKIESLYSDKVKLDSIYSDKSKLDSLYSDKSKLDSIYADKATLDSLYSDKATLDSLFSDKSTLDSLFNDKAKLDSLYADKSILDTLFNNLSNINAIVNNLTEILQADNNAAIALAQANIATTKANIATSQATTATSQANIATTKASEALSSATSAATSASTAITNATTSSSNASNASNSAIVATSKAELATTKANEAIAAKDEIQSYVIPTEATYNKDLLDTKISSRFVSSGVVNKQDDANVFKTVVGNEYKMANTDRFVNFDGNIIDTYGEELIANGDFSDDGASFDLTTGWSYNGNKGVVSLGDGSFQRFTQYNNANFAVGDTVKIEVATDYPTVVGVHSVSAGISEFLRADGTAEFTFVSDDLMLYTYATYPVTITNISVKEITTIDMTNNIPEVIVQDQATNGLEVQSSVGAGDYVVIDKEELVSTDLTQWGDGSITPTIDGEWYKATLTGSSFENIKYNVSNYDVGTEVVIKFTVDVSNSSDATTELVGLDNKNIYFEGSGAFYYTHTVGTNGYVAFIFRSDTGYVLFKDVSVQLKSDIYRAERDTADMYDYEDISYGYTFTLKKDETVVKYTGVNPYGVDGHYYRWLLPDENVTSLTTTRLDNTSYWQDLGTAENMSLLNPYFKDRTQYGITNKILATMKDDGTIKTEVCFVDTDIEDCGNAHKVMTDNGYSKLSNGLYSKGSDVVTPLGTWSTLNKGAYHPYFNYFGVSHFWTEDFASSDNIDWYNATWVNSTSDCSKFAAFNRANGGGISVAGAASQNPQGKFYDIIYPDQWIDLRIEANAISEQDELNRVGTKAKSGQLDGIGGVVSTMHVSTTTPSGGIYAGADYITFLYGRLFFPNLIGLVSVGDMVTFTNGTLYLIGKVTTFNDSGITFKSYDITTTNIAYNNNTQGAGVSSIASVTRVLPIPSSNTALRTDWIGNPANYPQAVKDRLASGLPMIGMNPLLVGQDGSSYIPADDLTYTYTLSNKVIGKASYIRLNSDGTLHSSNPNVTIDSITNTDYYSSILNRVVLESYTAKIPTTQVSEPKAVKLVGNYVTGTNSHSIYKGNQLVPTGKVNVGNGSNGLESKVIENINIPLEYDYKISYGTVNGNLEAGTVLYQDGGSTYGESGGYYSRTNTLVISSWNTSTQDVSNTSNYIRLDTTPSHSTISLDNSNSPAVKFIETIAEDDDGMAHYQVFAQEVATNAGAYDGDDGEFTQLTNGTLTDDNANTVKTIVASRPLNKYIWSK